MSDLSDALTLTTERVVDWVRTAMREHQCCYDPATATSVATELLAPLAAAVNALQDTPDNDQKGG